MRNVIFDIECDNLLDNVSVLHSIAIIDRDTGKLMSCANQPGYTPLSEGIKVLESATSICGHNIIGYDVPALKKLVPGFSPKGEVLDTLVMARTAYPDLKPYDVDSDLPTKEWGRHSLKAWGMRIGTHKTQYDHGFDEWSQEMQNYCEDDTRATYALYKFLEEEQLSPESLAIEHKLADYLFHQEQNGFLLDIEKANKLSEELEEEYNSTLKELQDNYFKMWVEAGDVVVPKVNGGRWKDVYGPKTTVFAKRKGCAFQNIKIKKFTGGPQQIKQCLKRFYGWEPDIVSKRKRTGDTFAKVWEEEGTESDILARLGFDCIPTLLAHIKAKKLRGMVATGKNGWLKLVDEQGFIHGRVNPNGTVTHRATHSKPNISQVPAVDEEDPYQYGKRCRELFKVPEGFSLLGCDAKGLELRVLAHYMHHYDGGSYANEIVTGDIHTTNQLAAGLSSRSQAKSFIYAFAYGAGAAKVGSIVLPVGSEEEQKQQGIMLKNKFLRSLPALNNVIKDCKKEAKRNGSVESIDGRATLVKQDYRALNCLLQSGGSIIVKKWICLMYDELVEELGPPGWDGLWSPCSYSHDEVQIGVREGHQETVKKIMLSTMEKAGLYLGCNIKIEGDVKIGKTWADTH